MPAAEIDMPATESMMNRWSRKKASIGTGSGGWVCPSSTLRSRIRSIVRCSLSLTNGAGLVNIRATMDDAIRSPLNIIGAHVRKHPAEATKSATQIGSVARRVMTPD